MKTRWRSGEYNPSDVFTKNLPGPDFRKMLQCTVRSNEDKNIESEGNVQGQKYNFITFNI